jgi:hypothetical protein
MGTIDRSKPRNLPRAFALVGIAIGCLCVLAYWLDYTFNPFNLPTVGSLGSSDYYSAPWAHKFLHNLIFVLCPGQFLHLFTIGIGGPFVWVVWFLGVLLNGPIYYLVGLLVSNIKASWRSGA